MPVRFRRTFTLFPGVKVNVSKGGMSITVGRKGFHLNFSKRGVRQTVGLPGSGISQTSYLYKNDPDEEETEKKSGKEEAEKEEAAPTKKKHRTRTRPEAGHGGSSPWGFFAFTFIAVFLIYVSGVFLGLIPPSNLITQFLQLLTEWTQQVGL
jgi:Protein of unknown function (DUF4236)